MSDYEKLESIIKADGYKPVTTMDNLITMIFLYFDHPDIEEEGYERYTKDGDFNMDECVGYVKDSGGWKEFDWVD